MRSSLFCAYFSRFSSEVCYYNLSPQGDGNFVLCPDVLLSHITTYPRKGTETVDLLGSIHIGFQLQLIPARGRKPIYSPSSPTIL